MQKWNMELVFWIFVCHVKIIKYFKSGTLIICWALAAIYRTYIWRLQNVTDWPHPPSVSILTQVNHLKTTNLNLQIVVITQSTEITNNKTNLSKSQNFTQEMTSLWSLHPLPCFLGKWRHLWTLPKYRWLIASNSDPDSSDPALCESLTILL